MFYFNFIVFYKNIYNLPLIHSSFRALKNKEI